MRMLMIAKNPPAKFNAGVRNGNSGKALMKILEEEFFTVRCWAVRALGESGARKAIPALVKVQKEDPSKEVRKEAGLALKRIKDMT